MVVTINSPCINAHSKNNSKLTTEVLGQGLLWSESLLTFYLGGVPLSSNQCHAALTLSLLKCTLSVQSVTSSASASFSGAIYAL